MPDEPPEKQTPPEAPAPPAETPAPKSESPAAVAVALPSEPYTKTPAPEWLLHLTQRLDRIEQLLIQEPESPEPPAPTPMPISPAPQPAKRRARTFKL